MKIALLTTDTTHHTYFVQQLSNYYDIEIIVVEQNSLQAPFAIDHSFEDARELYEMETFFNNSTPSLKDFASVFETENANNKKCVDFIKKISPDIIIVFGTGRLKPEIINCCPGSIINLHGGDPEKYRGLDSHLWAIYHEEFQSLITTLHHLNEDLDDGDIILQKPIKLYKSMPIHHLRHHNTDVCIELTICGLDMYKRNNHFISRYQKKRGRYYSFMPLVLKDICVKKFNKYVEHLR